MIQVTSSVQVLAIIASLALMGFVVWLIHKGRLREETALWWLATAGLLLVLSGRRSLLESTAHTLGIYYPPSLLLLGVILAGTLLALHFSIALTRLQDQVTRLAQEVALLEYRNETQHSSQSLALKDGQTSQRVHKVTVDTNLEF